MHPHLYPAEPNLIAETYRNHVVQLPRRFEKQYDFIDINENGLFLLGTSNLTGRIWCGSMWVFEDISDPPDVDKCLAGMEFESGIPVGKWFDKGTKVISGTDSGAVHVLSLTSRADYKKHYLSSIAIVSEHDDTITAVDATTDSSRILSGSIDMSLKVWDADSVVCERTYEYAHANIVTSACFQPGEQDIFVSTSTDGTALLWDSHLDKPASLLTSTESGYMACCWIDGNCVALGGNDGSVSTVDLRMKCQIDKNSCSMRPIYFMRYFKERELLAVCADDPVVRVFNCKDHLLNNVYECERHADFVRGLAWESPDKLYSCAWDSAILAHKIAAEGTDSDTSIMDKTEFEARENGETEPDVKCDEN